MKGLALLAASSLALSSVPAAAATMVQSDNEFEYFGFDPFDAALGTLNSVTLTIELWRPRAWLMSVESEEPTTASVEWAVAGTWVLPGSDATGGMEVLVPLTGSGTADVSLTWLDGGRAYGIFGVDGTGSVTLSLDTAAFLGDRIFFNGFDPGFFDNVGDTSLTYGGSASFLHLPSGCPTGDDAYEEAEDGCGWVSYTLTYDYTPAVPEPGTWAMMLIGFAGVGMALRRSRRLALA